MLNAKALSDLLSSNRDDRLCKRWYLMTPNGTLLAYSKPADINDLRKQAAMAAISWQEYQHHHQQQQHRAAAPPDDEEEGGKIRTDARAHDRPSPLPFLLLHTLTIETESSNIIMQSIQKHLLLVLEGGVAPRRAGFVKAVTAEGEGGVRLLADGEAAGTSSSSSPPSSGNAAAASTKIAANVLKLQRKKLDALAEVIVQDFEKTGFRMPEDGSGSTLF
jgi:hypothetical protein